MNYYIYMFYDKNSEIIYVGKTIDLKKRFYQHKKEKIWWNEIVKVEVAIVDKKIWWDIYEQYYINKYKTKYNIKDTNIRYKKFDYPELNFEEVVGIIYES